MSSPPLNWPLPVIILAGGYGTRVRHLLPGIPKPMAPVNGRPFVEWVIRFFAAHGCTDFILSTGHLAEVIDQHFSAQPVPGVHVTCVPETSPQGTAGGCHQAATARPDAPAWLVVNGDSLVLADPRPLLDHLQQPDCDAALLGLAMPDTGRFGTLEVTPDHRLTAFREKTPGAGLINAGVYAFKTTTLDRFLSHRPLSLETDIFPPLAAAGRVRVATTDAPFLDIGTPETLAQSARFITQNESRFQ